MTGAAPVGGSVLDLAIGGMTCASCANRIERKLNKLDGIQASVNYATEKATVLTPTGYDPAALVAQVRAAETAFAATMAARDHAAFTRFLAADAVFLSEPRTFRGRDEVAAAVVLGVMAALAPVGG